MAKKDRGSADAAESSSSDTISSSSSSDASSESDSDSSSCDTCRSYENASSNEAVDDARELKEKTGAERTPIYNTNTTTAASVSQ